MLYPINANQQYTTYTNLVLLGNMPHIDPLQWTMQYLASSSGAPYSH